MQKLALARLSRGEIWAVDNHHPFIDSLRNNAVRSGLGRYIKTFKQDMFKMDLPEKYFDLIWAEGSLFICGFENALRDWKKFFRKKVRFAFTEATWFQENIPDEVRRVWAEYPPMSGIDETVKRIKDPGYEVTSYFKLLKDSRETGYCKPLRKALTA